MYNLYILFYISFMIYVFIVFLIQAEGEDDHSTSTQNRESAANKYSKLAFSISAKNIPKPNSEQSKRIAKIFAQKFSKDSK